MKNQITLLFTLLFTSVCFASQPPSDCKYLIKNEAYATAILHLINNKSTDLIQPYHGLIFTEVTSFGEKKHMGIFISFLKDDQHRSVAVSLKTPLGETLEIPLENISPDGLETKLTSQEVLLRFFESQKENDKVVYAFTTERTGYSSQSYIGIVKSTRISEKNQYLVTILGIDGLEDEVDLAYVKRDSIKAHPGSFPKSKK